MNSAHLTIAEVFSAAEELLAAFRATDTRAYFASFTHEATFIFHTERRPLLTKAEYEVEWEGWVESGWLVREVESTEQRVDIYGPTAVFSHLVQTTTSTRDVDGGELSVSDERETILFVRQADGSIRAVHEHLSADPSTRAGTK